MQRQFKLVSTLKYKKKNVNTDNRFEKLQCNNEKCFWKKQIFTLKNVDKIVLKVEFLSEHNWNPIKIQWTAVRLPESKFNNRLWWLKGRCATDQITLHKFSVFWVISFTSLLYKKRITCYKTSRAKRCLKIFSNFIRKYAVLNGDV